MKKGNTSKTPLNPRVSVNERLLGVARSIRKHCGSEEAAEANEWEKKIEARTKELVKADKTNS